MTHIRHIPRRPSSQLHRRHLSLAAKAGASTQSLRIPITNVYGGGDYTAQLLIGSGKASANVILDTGSSTLAVKPHAYNPAQDTSARATPLAQIVLYGTGGWAGPVLKTAVSLGGMGIPDAYVALAEAEEKNNFGQADGILGLAYNVMNNAFDLTAYLQKQGLKPDTYPWHLKVKSTQSGLEAFARELEGLPAPDLDPYFSALEEKNVVANKFAFYTLRSFPHISSANATLATLANDKLNQGFLILGGGEEQADLYTGSFAVVSVVDDLYYNVNLKAVQVGNQPAAPAAPLQAQFVKDAGSNAIVDSGTNSLVFSADVCTAIVNALERIIDSFEKRLHSCKWFYNES